MKKWLFTVIVSGVSLCSLSSALAEEAGLTFGDPVLTASLEFEAEYSAEENMVYMTWNPWQQDLMWYKVVRSQTNPNPLYPEEESVCYSPDKNTTGCVDFTPYVDKTFYRICAITHAKERFCSNVVAIDPAETTETESVQAGEDLFCAQVITPAVNSKTGECVEYPTPCDVPDNWLIPESGSCVQESLFLSATIQQGVIHLTWQGIPEANGVQILKKEGADSDLFSPFQDGVQSLPLSEENIYLDTSVVKGSTYSYRLCVPEGTGCSYSSNIVVLTLEDEVLPDFEKSEEQIVSPFSDVSLANEEGQAIIKYANRGVVSGFPDETFHPEKSVTRAEIAKMATLAVGVNPSSAMQKIFCDVPTDSWFAKYIDYFVSHGYANGFEGGECDLERFFSPHSPVLRAEALKMSTEVFNIDISLYEDTPFGFIDIPNGHWVMPYAKAAYTLNIFDGELMRPDAPATRGEIMLLLSRAEAL